MAGSSAAARPTLPGRRGLMQGPADRANELGFSSPLAFVGDRHVADGLYYLQMVAQGLERELPRWRSSFGSVTLRRSTPRGGVGSVECAGREHEARRSPWLGLAAGVKTRPMEALSGRCLHGSLGLPAVSEYPGDDRLGVSTCGHDRRPLDHGAAGGMSSGEASEQSPNRVVVHAYHGSPYPAIGLCRTR